MANQNYAKEKADELVEKADKAAEKAAQKAATITEEIDIRAIFITIWEFIISIFNRLIFFIITLKRIHIKYFKLLVLIGILIGGGALAFHFTRTDYYKSSITIHSKFLRGTLLEKTIEKLDVLADDENYEELSRVMGIPLEDAQKIQGFKIVPLVPDSERFQLQGIEDKFSEVLDPDDTKWILERRNMENELFYEIVLYVYDYNVLPKLEQPILNYIANRPYVKKRMDIHVINLKKRRAKLVSETEKIDSLKSVIMRNFEALTNRSREGNNNVILSERTLNNPLEVMKEDLRLAADIREIDRALFLETDLELLDSFTLFVKPDNASLFFLAYVSGLATIGLFYILVIFIEVNKWLREKERQFLEKTNDGNQLDVKKKEAPEPETSTALAGSAAPSVG